MNASHSQTRRSSNSDRPFPWRCRHCGKSQVVMATVKYDAEVRHDGRLQVSTVPDLGLPVCEACGNKVFTEKVGDRSKSAPVSIFWRAPPNSGSFLGHSPTWCAKPSSSLSCSTDKPCRHGPCSSFPSSEEPRAGFTTVLLRFLT
jgi:hypothetical protein